MSKLSKLKINSQRFIAMVITNLVLLPTFYRYMATKSKTKQVFYGMVPLLVFYSIVNFPVSDILFPLTAVSVLIMCLPMFLFASAVDPTIGWIRGEIDKPKSVFGQVFLLHVWAVFSAVIPVGLVISGLILFSDMSPESLDMGAGPGMIFMLYAVLVGLHLIMALRNYPDVRTPQKLISILTYVILFWAPVIIQVVNALFA